MTTIEHLKIYYFVFSVQKKRTGKIKGKLSKVKLAQQIHDFQLNIFNFYRESSSVSGLE